MLYPTKPVVISHSVARKVIEPLWGFSHPLTVHAATLVPLLGNQHGHKGRSLLCYLLAAKRKGIKGEPINKTPALKSSWGKGGGQKKRGRVRWNRGRGKLMTWWFPGSPVHLENCPLTLYLDLSRIHGPDASGQAPLIVQQRQQVSFQRDIPHLRLGP